MRRLVAFALEPRLPRKLAQLLTVGARKGCQDFGKRRIALRNQTLAQRFEAMQVCGFAPRVAALMRERSPYRLEFFFAAPQLLGKILHLTLARDVLRNAPRAHDFVAQFARQRQLRKLRIAQLHQRLRQFKNGERFAPALATTDVVGAVGAVGCVAAHRGITIGLGNSVQ